MIASPSASKLIFQVIVPFPLAFNFLTAVVPITPSVVVNVQSSPFLPNIISIGLPSSIEDEYSPELKNALPV